MGYASWIALYVRFLPNFLKVFTQGKCKVTCHICATIQEPPYFCHYVIVYILNYTKYDI